MWSHSAVHTRPSAEQVQGPRTAFYPLIARRREVLGGRVFSIYSLGFECKMFMSSHNPVFGNACGQQPAHTVPENLTIASSSVK